MSYERRTIAPNSPWAISAACLMIIAALMMLFKVPQTMSDGKLEATGVIVLLFPPAACVCAAVMLVSRKNSLVPTVLPIGAVCLYAAARSVNGPIWSSIIACFVCLLVAALYLLTVTGLLGSRIPLLISCAAAAVWIVLAELPFVFKPMGVSALFGCIALAIYAAAVFCVACGMRRGRLY